MNRSGVTLHKGLHGWVVEINAICCHSATREMSPRLAARDRSQPRGPGSVYEAIKLGRALRHTATPSVERAHTMFAILSTGRLRTGAMGIYDSQLMFTTHNAVMCPYDFERAAFVCCFLFPSGGDHL